MKVKVKFVNGDEWELDFSIDDDYRAFLDYLRGWSKSGDVIEVIEGGRDE